MTRPMDHGRIVPAAFGAATFRYQLTCERQEMNGLSTSRATPVATSSGGLILSIGENGESTSGRPIHGHFDVCPIWLELAVRHLSDAQVGQVSRDAAWSSSDENAKAGALEGGFEASMHAIMASSTAVDAFC